jgi:hypothetical protein
MPSHASQRWTACGPLQAWQAARPGAGIANAFFDATSVLEYPLTPERVKAALATRTWMPL